MRAQRIPRIKLRQGRNATFDLAYPRTSGLRQKRPIADHLIGAGEILPAHARRDDLQPRHSGFDLHFEGSLQGTGFEEGFAL